MTGSCYVIRAGDATLLLECGQVQGERQAEERNADLRAIPITELDAVVLSHAHIDHSGRIPLLVKNGYTGPIYTHHATRALCEIMLADSGYLHEKDAEWENKLRRRQNRALVTPLYTREDALAAMPYFEGVDYGEAREILPGIRIRFSDAGHILGAAIVELWHDDHGQTTKLAFSGDLGYKDAPVMPDPAIVQSADLLLMESTYGDRRHRPYADTLEELAGVFTEARRAGGNILIPAFAVGRSQDLLYLLSRHYDEWALGGWRMFLDSPMAIDATRVYARYQHLYDVPLFDRSGSVRGLPNLALSRTSNESMSINEIREGAIIIAGSGMCTGGRIHHHLKHNVSRPESHIVIIGFQAYGTLGRRLVDGADSIRLWGEEHRVRANVHTIGGLSAHADQEGLVEWFGNFGPAQPVCLVHGEEKAQRPLREALQRRFDAHVTIPHKGDRIEVRGDSSRRAAAT